MKYTEEQTCLEVDLYFQHYIFSSAIFGWKPKISRVLAHHGFLKNLIQTSCHCQCCLKAEIPTHKARFHLTQRLYKDQWLFQSIISGISLLLTGKEQVTNNSTGTQFWLAKFFFCNVIYTILSLMSSSILNRYIRYQAVNSSAKTI